MTIKLKKNTFMKKISNPLILSVFSLILFSACTKNSDEQLVNIKSKPMRVQATATPCDWAFQYVDNFDNANVNNDYGLNDNLPNRQLYGPWQNTTWVRKGGAWFDYVVQPWFSQVNHPFTPNALTFHLEYSAVMLNELITTGVAGRYRISFRTDPVKGDVTNGSWTSFMLDATNSNSGYVTGTQFGFAIGSNGGVSVFQNGHAKVVTGSVPAATEYNVVLDIKAGSLIASINGVQLTATLDESLPTAGYAYLGAYIEPNSGFVSWFDDLIINTQYSTASKRVVNYGYYWVQSASYGEHFNEVVDYTNFNFIESITASTPNTKTNVLQVRWQFWGDSSGVLNSNWLSLWNTLLAQINQNINKIAALYVFDEPFWAVPCSVSDYNMVLNQIKADLPTMPIIAVFAYPTVNDLADTRIASVNNNLTWVGADKYVPFANFAEVVTMNNNLKNKRPNNNTFLIPQTHFEGTLTDADVATINWMYYNQALSDTKVIGLWNFGLWCFTTPAQVPITLQVQKLIGKAITTY